MKTREESLQLLNKFIDKKDIETREQSGRTLSYIDGHYVINQLNNIFGNTNWSYEIKDLKCVSDNLGKTKTGKDAYFVGYICQVILKVPNLLKDGELCVINEIGFGSGIDSDQGKSHESATKEAVTDAVKRCAKNLGNSMGLCLYDKSFKATSSEVKKESTETTQEKDMIVVKANVSFEEKELAKSAGFKFYPEKKAWLKKINKTEIDHDFGFEIQKI